MDLVTAEEALVADELLDGLEGLGVVPYSLLPAWARGKPKQAVSPVPAPAPAPPYISWKEIYKARRARRAAQRAAGKKMAPAVRKARETDEGRKRRLNKLAAKNRHLVAAARANEASALARVRVAQADAVKFGRRAKGYERSASAYQRQADAIIVFRAVSV